MAGSIARIAAWYTGVFFGWKVVGAAFVVAMFTWGIGLYGLSIFVSVIERNHRWPVAMVSAAVTCNMVIGGIIFNYLRGWYQRFGVARVTQAGAVLTGVGLAGWAYAAEPWQLFAVTPISAAGWAMTSGAAFNAMVAPWFDQRRPAAIAWVYTGTGAAGIVFSPLWVWLIGVYGFPHAAIIVGVVCMIAVCTLAERFFSTTPAEMGLQVDDGIIVPAPQDPGPRQPIADHRPWREWRLATQIAACALAMFAQIGIVMQLFSLLRPALGSSGAGSVISVMTLFTLLGRIPLMALMRPATNRRTAAILNTAVMVVGSAAFTLSAGSNIPLLVTGSVLFGLGSGNLAPLPQLIAQSEFQSADVQRVVGLVFGVSQVCFAFAPLAFGELRALAGTGDVAGQFRIVFLAAGLLQLGAIAALLIGMPHARRAVLVNSR